MLAKCWADRIRLIAIETMKGAFGNESALRFFTRGATSRAGVPDFTGDWLFRNRFKVAAAVLDEASVSGEA